MSMLRWTLVLAFGFCVAATGAHGLDALIVDGQNNHDWKATTPVLKQLLEETGLFKVDVATSPPKGAPNGDFVPAFADYDVIVLNYNGESWCEAAEKSFEDYVSGGGNVVSYHAADNPFADWEGYCHIIGVGGWGGRTEKDGPLVRWKDGKMFLDHETVGRGGSHPPQHDFQIITRDRNHPITKGLPEKWMHRKDELYSLLRGPAKNLHVLATAYCDPKIKNGTGEHEPMLMTIKYGKGRVFHTTLGHAVEQMTNVGFIVTFQRGAEWAATGKVTRGAVPDDFPTADKTSVRN